MSTFEIEIEKLLKKDTPEALTLIYDHFGEKLYHYLLTILRSENHAQDCLQNLFLKLSQKKEKLKKIKNWNAFLYRTAHNQAIDYIRKKKHPEEPLEHYHAILTVESTTNPRMESQALYLLNELPHEQQLIITLKIFQKKTFSEIADILAVPSNTVASRYRYGIAKIRKSLDIFQKHNL